MIANYCLIKQNLASLVADSSDDSDRYPDVAQISGQVTFTPTTPQGQTYKITGEDGKLYTVPVTAITARIEDGKIMHEGEEGVYVFAGGEASNPRKVVYRASYSGLRAGGRGGVISLNAVTFEAIPGGEIDLTTVTPVSGSPAPGIVKGDPFLYEDFTPEQLEALRGPQGEPGPLTFADFTPEQLEIIRGPQGDKGDNGDKGDQGIPGDVTQLRGEITTEIAALVDGAPEDLDTLREIAAYAEANRGITDQLNAAIGGKADKAHTHSQGDITGLSAALNNKADKTHTHETSQVVGLDNALTGKADKAHTHAQSDISGLSTSLSNKADKTHTHTQAQVTGLSTALSGKANTSHTHTTADITDYPGHTVIIGPSSHGKIPIREEDSDNLRVGYPPAETYHATSKKYVDEEVAKKANASHTHTTSQISGLSTALNDKADKGHTHASADITDAVDHIHGGRAGRLVQVGEHGHIRDGNPPTDQYDLTNKGYVDGEVAKKANTSHTHTAADITDFSTEMDKKANKSHTHSQSQITGLSTALSGKADSTHTHTQGEVTGLTAALAAIQKAIEERTPQVQVVDKLPVNPDSNTLYVVREATK